MKSAIIGLLLVGATLLSGCGAMRLAYDRAPDALYWWLDGYADFDDAQSEQVSVALGRFADWHRATQLPDYARLLAQAEAQVLAAAPATGPQVCRFLDEVMQRSAPLVDRALPSAAALVMTLTPAQLGHIQRKQQKVNAKFRDDYLQPDPEDRLDAAVERVVDRAETLYGRLDRPQEALVRKWVAASPFDPQVWLAERQQRQRELLATLRQLQADRASPEQAQAALRALVARTQSSPREAFRQYNDRLRAYNCQLAADLHNATSREQRQRAAERLRGWVGDFRALSAAAR